MKKYKSSLTARRNRVGYLFIMPWVIGFLLFFANNLYKTVIFSLSSMSMRDGGGYDLLFVGIENYKSIFFSHSTFTRILVESMGEMMVDVPLIISFSLFSAIILNQKFKGRVFARAVFFLPVIMSSQAIVAAIQGVIATVSGGVSTVDPALGETVGINVTSIMQILEQFGVPKFFSTYIIGSVSRMFDIVKASGIQIIIFMAGLQSISGALYEVAKIEGATAYQTFWKVTFPLLTPMILTNVVYTIIDRYINTEIVKLISNTTFGTLKFGLGSAMTFVSSAIVCLILGVVALFIAKRVSYQY